MSDRLLLRLPKRGPLEGGKWRAWRATRNAWRIRQRAVALGLAKWSIRKPEDGRA